VTPALRLVAAGVGAVALLAVVALASRGGLGGGDRGGGPSSTLLDYGFTIFVVLYLLAIPFAIWAYVVHGRESRHRRAEGKRSRGLLAQLVLFVVIAGLVATVVAQRHAVGDRQQTIQLPAEGEQTPPPRPQTEGREPQFRWPAVAVLALAAAGAGLLLLRRRRAPSSREPALAAELATALDDAIDDVRAEADPRRAVVKAYARMEAILAAHGLPRREAEAPYEYLVRALGTLVASARGVERLTALYEEARFSRHEIDPGMRDEAVAALAAVREELRGA
jgi:hypothetical protein